MNLRNWTVVGLILLAVVSRLIPHPPNFACVGAVGLFAGAVLRRPIALVVPPAALLASDAVIGFFAPVVMLSVYTGFALSVLLGRFYLSRRLAKGNFVVASLINACVFFVISNFGCFLAGMYPMTWDGLVQCYVLAIPFFPNTVLGDLIYGAVLFGGYALARRRALQVEWRWEPA